MQFIQFPASAYKRHQPAQYFRKTLALGRVPGSATLTISACGLYACFINGTSVTQDVLNPGFTYYRKRLQYQDHEVSHLLQKGVNTIVCVLGNGWYKGKVGILRRRNIYGKTTMLAARLSIDKGASTMRVLDTDRSWRVSSRGPLVHNDLMDGEIYDARREFENLFSPDFDDSEWPTAQLGSYEGELVPSLGERIQEMETFVPTVITQEGNEALLDFGQNMVGYVEFRVQGASGHTVTLRHGEVLDEHGRFTLKNLMLEGVASKVFPVLQQKVEYTLKDGSQTYKPTFCVHGFRYVRVSGWPEEVVAENFKGIAVYSRMRELGDFECSNRKINRLISNTRWSMKGNFLDIPTDCPTRERAGWTGDIAAFCEAGSYLMDTRRFLSKWLADLASQQSESGEVHNVIPDMGYPRFLDGSAGWGDAAVIVPYALYRMYGDLSVVRQQYDSMRSWLSFVEKRASRRGRIKNLRNPHKRLLVDTGFHFGEWLEPGTSMSGLLLKNLLTTDAEVATAYFAHSANLFSEMADAIGNTEDAVRYRLLFEEIKQAYRYTFTHDGVVRSTRQCRYVRPLALDLLNEEDKLKNAVLLNELVIENDYRIGTGFLTTPYVLPVLTDYGFSETAFRMAENEQCPGWLYAVNKGATTIWENWNGVDSDNVPTDSHNHYAFGAVVKWYFSHVAGIRPGKPGFQEVDLKPMPGGSLDYARANYETPYGLVTSSWEIDNQHFKLTIQTPVEANVTLPDGSCERVGSGSHAFECRMP